LRCNRALPTHNPILVVDGDGVITNRIIGANPQQSMVNLLVAILEDHAATRGPEVN
jgi:hypothetical protein